MMVDSRPHRVPAKKILWIDLEMTGFSPADDPIMEIAAIITDWDFTELEAYHTIVKNRVPTLKRRMDLNDWWLGYPENRKAFLESNADGKTIKTAESELLDVIDKHFDKNLPVLLAGNSIHVDRRFIEAQMPKLNSRLNYRMLDVTAWKVVFQGKYKKMFAAPNAHRALDDIRVSIKELKYYLGYIKK